MQYSAWAGSSPKLSVWKDSARPAISTPRNDPPPTFLAITSIVVKPSSRGRGKTTNLPLNCARANHAEAKAAPADIRAASVADSIFRQGPPLEQRYAVESPRHPERVAARFVGHVVAVLGSAGDGTRDDFSLVAVDAPSRQLSGHLKRVEHAWQRTTATAPTGQPSAARHRPRRRGRGGEVRPARPLPMLCPHSAVVWRTHGLPPQSGTVTADTPPSASPRSAVPAGTTSAPAGGTTGETRCPSQALRLAGRRG